MLIFENDQDYQNVYDSPNKAKKAIDNNKKDYLRPNHIASSVTDATLNNGSETLVYLLIKEEFLWTQVRDNSDKFN